MSIPIWQIDAFADGPFTGNPAAVCILDEFPDDRWMQKLASEMNLSETAFVVPTAEDGNYRLRWFTPASEVALCGHATLATVHALVEQGGANSGEPIRFQSLSGELVCQQQGHRITLDFPATPILETVDGTVAADLLSALGIAEGQVMRSKFDMVAIVKDADAVRDAHPDFGRLEKIATRGVMISSKSDDQALDFISRFFAPRCGVNEDPVTGSAHCCLAPFWSQQIGKTKLVGYQASHRGGTVHCEVVGDRVLLSGTAVTVMEGNLLFDPTPKECSHP